MAFKSTLAVLDLNLAICQLEANADLPVWVLNSEFYSVVRTQQEISFIVPSETVPNVEQPGLTIEKGWRCFQLDSPSVALSLTGVITSLTSPLAEAGISVFAMSTFSTELIMVKDEMFTKAVSVLSNAGHTVKGFGGN